MSTHAPTSGPKKKMFSTLASMVVGAGLIVVGATTFQNVSPPILQGIDFHLGRMISNLGVVLVFVKVIDIFFYRPLSDAIHQRHHEIETTFSQAEQLRSQMKQMKEGYEHRLEQTEAEARTQIQNQLKEAQLIKQQLTQEAEEKASQLLRRAEEEVHSYRDQVLNDLRVHTVDLTLKATEELIHKNVDSDVNRKLVAEFMQKLEVERV